MMHKAVLGLLLLTAAFNRVIAQPNAVGFVTVQIPPGFSVLANPLYAEDNTLSALFRAANLPEGTTIYTLVDRGATGLANEGERSITSEFLPALPNELSAPIQITLADDRVTLDWSGSLQTSTDVAGPYEAPPQIISSVQVSQRSPFRFWRARILAPMDLGRFKMNVWSSGSWSDPTQILSPGEGVVWLNPSGNNLTITFLGLIPQGRFSNPIPAGWSIRSAVFPATGGITSRTKLELTPGDHLFYWEAGTFRQYTFLGANRWSPEEPQTQAARAFLIYANKALTWETDLSLGD